MPFNRSFTHYDIVCFRLTNDKYLIAYEYTRQWSIISLWESSYIEFVEPKTNDNHISFK